MPEPVVASASETLRDAEEHLRLIRSVMERSTRYSTFSGYSGILVGATCAVGSGLQALADRHGPDSGAFLLRWFCVSLVCLLIDLALTKRRAAQVGKSIVSHLGRQMAGAAGPALAAALAITVLLVRRWLFVETYLVWSLCYGAAVCAVGLLSQRDVTALGISFVVAGLIGGFIVLLGPAELPGAGGPIFIACTFGLFHVAYGIRVARRDGW